MTVRLGYDAHSTACATVASAVAELDEVHRDAERLVAGLLDAGWTGAAARSFDEAWLSWSAGAAELHGVLASILRALVSVGRDLRTMDEGADTALALLERRLGR